MNWFFNALTSGIGRKVIMSLTGLFLILFLLVHLAGNLQLLKSDGGESFNIYSHFMGNNPLIQFISKGNFFFIVLHIFVSMTLVIKNRQARPVRYKVYNGAANSSWPSRSMAILGTLILVFIVLHLYGFWYQFKNGALADVEIDGVVMGNGYAWVVEAYTNPAIAAFYVISMAVLGFHLWHGFASAFQSLGLNHVKYNGLIKGLGKLYAVAVPVGYAIIPIVLYIKSLS